MAQLKRKLRSRKVQRKLSAFKRGRKTVNVNRALAPFAQRYITKMKYAEVRTVTGPAAGGLVQYNFRLNSIFDPNLTGVGHQPYGHDQLADIYNRYRVYRVDYAISALNTDGATNYSVVGVVPANEQIATFIGVSDIMESPRAKYITQAPNAALKVLKGSVSLASLAGRTKSQYMSDDRYQAEFLANPAESLILNILAGTITGTGGTGGTGTNVMNLSISLVYHVECFDVRQQVQS